MEPIAQRCLDELAVALEQFGTYTFNDKGPGEVMDVYALANAFAELAPAEVAKAMREVVEAEPQRGERVVSAVLMHLQDWEELWAAHGDEVGRWL